ncbi:NAD-dependent epimerase/dehydratase family protein [Azospirillum sp. RWY-5-1]|uniref:NAD-dependent epimerase/dehydratase family protein n=1 Tax=Azospirillum oleiclasticum TaxID=2735135 RepID=A0ABX2TI97_9PROT|nr:NAD-dependent epimerase/dehydratase family protein [Azospirillum oleiclasticum]NYZ16577.1 NAD-dependent epimerase/dehydratase family protein [Azospirillum oleiclasticum]NYZ23953.1 NAD-dependent epimerase/dehydratase family protein [Azospirillum oleiclasticum]
MRVLILGGGVFLGRHLTDALLTAGHAVTHFKRRHQPRPGVELLLGDRDGDLSVLDGRRWDAVVDTCGYRPRQVDAAARRLRVGVPHYAFISSVNQYAGAPVPGIDEHHPSDTTPVPDEAPLDAITYGPLKAACEEALRRVYGDDALIVRPGCLVGPWDQAHRFPYWVRRGAAGGAMLVPGGPTQRWQVIDARDVAGWLVRMLERQVCGTYNAVGPAHSAAELMAALAGDSGTVPVWVPPDLLGRRPGGARWLDLAEWSALPAAWRWLYAINGGRAFRAGLRPRPLADSARDMRAWLEQVPPQPADALDPAAEASLLRLQANRRSELA